MDREKIWLWGGGVVAGVFILWLVWPSVPEAPPAPTYPPELAEAVRQSVEMVREAREETSAFVAWSGRWRLLALVIGVAAPLAAAYLIFRAATRSDPEETEIVAKIVEKRPDLLLPKPDTKALPKPRRQQLADHSGKEQ